MTGPARLMLLAELALIAFLSARAGALRPADRARAPGQHAWFAVASTVLPALALLGVWALVAPALVTRDVLAGATAHLPPPGFERSALLWQARAGVGPPALVGAYAARQARYDWLATGLMLLVAAAGYGWATLRQRQGTAPRPATERLVVALLGLASLLAVLVTAAILFTLLWESGRFFGQVSPLRFLFGAHWSPQTIDDADPAATLGAAPLLWGSFLIGAVIAMAVAVPLGLLSAIYLTQYASRRARAWLKPALEVLAGVPTVVYGYVAALLIAPAVRQLGVALGSRQASGESALAAGLVIGVMVIPYVSSASDDALAAVPTEWREASLALGATPYETVRHILLPAALPGVIGGMLLAISRAIGETVIVVMAASAVATLSLDPFAPATTVTRQIVDLLTGEATFDSVKTLAAFALGLLLFAATLPVNLLALRAMRRAPTAHG